MGAHKCCQCGNSVHVFCGIAESGTEEGYGQPVICFKCQPKQNSEDTEDSTMKSMSRDPKVSGIRTSLVSLVLDSSKICKNSI